MDNSHGIASGKRTEGKPAERPATRDLLILGACLGLLLLYLAIERVRLDRALRRVQRRIAVTGTRGKSGVTRLVASGLRASGARVLAKTTGSKPLFIFPDGSEREIPRAGPPSVREQIRLVALAAATGADTLVSEMMSIGAECLAVESRRILRPGTLALTNVRLDHLEEMGRRKEEIARTLASAFPERADIFVLGEEVYPVFAEMAARTKSRLHPVALEAAGEGPGRGPRSPVLEFEPNLRLAQAVLVSLGIGEEGAAAGFAAAAPDPGGLRIWRGEFGDPPRPAVCVSAFAANDPESSAAALAKAMDTVPLAGRPLVGILSLREDRADRTLQWIRAAGEGFFRGFAAVILIGGPARTAARRLRRQAGPAGASFFSVGEALPDALMNGVFSISPGEPAVVGLGNFVGAGERLVRYWAERGTDHGR
jgi:poly-gamma-glutamate synthase PgsB/CapB